MYQLKASDFADTGQWRLLLEIGVTGLRAFLENTIHTEIPPQPLCQASWEFNKDKLKENIEDAVYNNPRLLDDFAARIILYDPRTLFIPTEIAEECQGGEEEIYQKVYSAETSDIMIDYDRDITAAWCLAPGVKSFLMRTFPGARITSNLMEKVRQFRHGEDFLRLYAIAREGEADIIMLDGDALISASTHEWNHTDDIAFLVLNLIDVYDKKLGDVKVITDNVDTSTEAWKYIYENNKR